MYFRKRIKLERTRAVFCSNITPNQFSMFGAFSGQIGEFKLGKIPERKNFDISQLCIAHSRGRCCRAQEGDSGQKLRADAGQTETRPECCGPSPESPTNGAGLPRLYILTCVQPPWLGACCQEFECQP